MSTEIVNDSDELQVGFVGVPSRTGMKSIPCLGVKRSKRASLRGIGFNSQINLAKAIDFLNHAYTELYGVRKTKRLKT